MDVIHHALDRPILRSQVEQRGQRRGGVDSVLSRRPLRIRDTLCADDPFEQIERKCRSCRSLTGFLVGEHPPRQGDNELGERADLAVDDNRTNMRLRNEIVDDRPTEPRALAGRGRHRLQHVDASRTGAQPARRIHRSAPPMPHRASVAAPSWSAAVPRWRTEVRRSYLLCCGHILPRLDMAIARQLPAISEGSRRSLLFQIVSDG